ncbi:MAG: histidinol-phosphate aminotransferase [Saprospiraceae bacterium]|jgi:histidinol-phosphate aminotransferase
MKFNLEKLVRPNILKLQAYSSARSEFIGKDGILLDANENPFGNLNRYPDPLQKELKSALSNIKRVSTEQIFIGNGSDEVIDLAFRIFCKPGEDKVLTFTPTYGMYKVSAAINDVEVLTVGLDTNFQIDTQNLKPVLQDRNLKIVFLCSPNNPTGNCLRIEDIEFILNNFSGIVIIDEAYIDFSEQKSWKNRLSGFPNLIISQTFSKAWGLAAARVGIAYMSPAILHHYNKVKPPYNVSQLNQNEALLTLRKYEKYEVDLQLILNQKTRLEKTLLGFSFVNKIYPSDANFLLVEVQNANELYDYLKKEEIIVRNRDKEVKNCLRFTVGEEKENDLLLEKLAGFQQQK